MKRAEERMKGGFYACFSSNYMGFIGVLVVVLWVLLPFLIFYAEFND